MVLPPKFNKKQFLKLITATLPLYTDKRQISLKLNVGDTLSPLFLDRFLRFCLREYDKKAISDDFMAHSCVLGEGVFRFYVILES